MKIIKLTASNLLRLRAVEITPDGDLVVIAGRNGAGKSSVLNAIWFALGGGRAQADTVRPIRDGEDHAEVTLDLGDLTVTRTWTRKSTSLKVTAADGSKLASPQAVLDELVGRLTFDPLAFAQQSPKDQVAALLDVVDLPVDLEQLDRDRAETFTTRTDVSRDLRSAEAALATAMPIPDGIPDEEISYTQLHEELMAADEVNRAAGDALNKANRLHAESDDAERAAKEARKRADDLGREYADALYAASQSKTIDTSPLRERMATAEATNRIVREKKDRAALTGRTEAIRARVAELTAELAEIDEFKRSTLAEAKMPVEGLSFDTDGVTFRGVPFAQCSSAEQLRVSVGIAMAMNPNLRVLRITDGSLLDSTSLKLIEEMAGEHDFQVWLEVVDETGRIGVTIEDGQVA